MPRVAERGPRRARERRRKLPPRPGPVVLEAHEERFAVDEAVHRERLEMTFPPLDVRRQRPRAPLPKRRVAPERRRSDGDRARDLEPDHAEDVEPHDARRAETRVPRPRPLEEFLVPALGPLLHARDQLPKQLPRAALFPDQRIRAPRRLVPLVDPHVRRLLIDANEPAHLNTCSRGTHRHRPRVAGIEARKVNDARTPDDLLPKYPRCSKTWMANRISFLTLLICCDSFSGSSTSRHCRCHSSSPGAMRISTLPLSLQLRATRHGRALRTALRKLGTAHACDPRCNVSKRAHVSPGHVRHHKT